MHFPLCTNAFIICGIWEGLLSREEEQNGVAPGYSVFTLALPPGLATWGAIQSGNVHSASRHNV